MLKKEAKWVDARQQVVGQAELQQDNVRADSGEIESNLGHQEGPKVLNKVEADDMGLLAAYKYLPLPSLAQFRQSMKSMNIKSCDDLILYS